MLREFAMAAQHDPWESQYADELELMEEDDHGLLALIFRCA